MPPTYQGRADVGRIITDISKRVERMERRQPDPRSSTAATGSVGGVVSRARAICNGASFPSGSELFGFSGYSDEVSFEWTNASNLKAVMGSLAFGGDVFGDGSISATSHLLVGVTVSVQLNFDAGVPTYPPDVTLQIYTVAGSGHQNISSVLPFTGPESAGPTAWSWYGELHTGDEVHVVAPGIATPDSIIAEIDITGLELT